ncbi:MAG TPA: carboxypeptidase-like regulatory domain-containing protein [Bacteroidia bacterium]|jgi:hypothetical protein|nr:carboxypeptidase-like regulatory domain-containing protein [Bacteroidia bacterium]
MFKRLLVLAILPIFVLTFSEKSNAQTKHTQLIQISGIVVDHDSAQKIPYVAVLIKKSWGGTIADNNGYFSFIAMPGDTILFQALGFKTNYYVLPDTLSTDKYSLIHVMSKDTTSLKPFVFYSWPSKEAFKTAFLKLDLPDNDLVRAKRNMALAARKARYGEARSPGTNYLSTVQQENDKLYYAGQYPPNNLLNPIAWAKFIQAWKDGSLNIQ